MKRICIFTSFVLPHLGGVERYTDKLLNELKKYKDLDITIVTCNYNNEQSEDSYNGYKMYRLPIYNVVKNRYPIIKKNKEYYKLIKEINSIDFDAYICQTRFYLLTQIGTKIAYKKNKRPIVIEHGSSHFTVNNKILDFFGEKLEHYLTRKIVKRKALFYGVSQRCNEWLKHFKIEASGVLYNSVDFDAYENYKNSNYKNIQNNNKIIISYIGRVIKEKGTGLLVEAFNEINNDSLELYIAGEGDYLEEIKKNNKNSNIHFEGKIPYEEVMSLLNKTDIFVHPSMYPEGLPTSILEAGIMKCAIIATDRGGTVEVINDPKYGIIMDENKESLVKSLQVLVNDKNKIEELKNNIFERVSQEFTWKKMAEKLVEEIEKNG